MKYQKLLKKLLTESGIFAVIIAVFGVGTYFLSDLNDEFQKENDSWQAKATEFSATTNTIRTKFDKVKKFKPLPEQIAQLQANGGLEINQQAAKNYFNQFRDQYFLNSVHLSMAPVAEMKGDNYHRKEDGIVSSEVSVDFDALADEYVYDWLEAIEQALPGSAKITKLTLMREGTLNDSALTTISKNGSFPLIKGNVKFTWLGIKTVETNETGNGANALEKK